MARKKKHPEHVNHERWLISYADFITLLFAFFVVMFAVSQVDTKKLGRFSESFNEALEWKVFEAKSGRGFMPEKKSATEAGNGKEEKLVASPASQDHLKREVEKELRKAPKLADIRILALRGELILRLPDKLLFESGGTGVRPDGEEALRTIAGVLRTKGFRVRIEGHSDDIPIKNIRFHSNWELSAARAASVVTYLIDTCKMDPVRLAAAGYGQYHPIAKNDSPAGRAMNRRVDIVVVLDSLNDPPTAVD
jgi:chemotaxis protein MotB